MDARYRSGRRRHSARQPRASHMPHLAGPISRCPVSAITIVNCFLNHLCAIGHSPRRWNVPISFRHVFLFEVLRGHTSKCKHSYVVCDVSNPSSSGSFLPG
jgi:hypothetical protein